MVVARKFRTAAHLAVGCSKILRGQGIEFFFPERDRPRQRNISSASSWRHRFVVLSNIRTKYPAVLHLGYLSGRIPICCLVGRPNKQYEPMIWYVSKLSMGLPINIDWFVHTLLLPFLDALPAVVIHAVLAWKQPVVIVIIRLMVVFVIRYWVNVYDRF